MNKPWWLWEGAAVRAPKWGNLLSAFGQVKRIEGENVWYGDEYSSNCEPIGDVIPIENPAVMLAHPDATHVEISTDGFMLYVRWSKHDQRFYTESSGAIKWPQCPDHLKGHTWELPK